MNVLTVTGQLATDPIRRDTSKGVVCEFRLAVDSRPRLWIVVQTWGQLAGRCAQHLTCGRHVAVSGPLLCEEYVTRAGNKATRWFTRATTVTFLDQPTRDGDASPETEVDR
ncbi:MAG: single-stranded DNA-binding protein [Actinomycetota bacterium]|nr:single-stranded DNA-binding protein [Actinomycetota bacterium]